MKNGNTVVALPIYINTHSFFHCLNQGTGRVIMAMHDIFSVPPPRNPRPAVQHHERDQPVAFESITNALMSATASKTN